MVSTSVGTCAPQRITATLTLLCMYAAWCLLCMMSPSETVAVAQGSASAMTGNCNYTIWTPTSPSEVPPIVYPPDAVEYQRQLYTTPPENFFISNWYIGIILILCAVCGIYVLLALFIVCHFDLYAQRQAQKVVEESYATRGYFHLNSKGAHGGLMQATESDDDRAASAHGHSSAFVLSASNSDGNSFSDDSNTTESPSSSSETDDTIIQINPFWR